MARRLALFLQNDSNDYQRLLRDDSASCARRLDFVVDVYASGDDHEMQIRQLRSVIGQPAGSRPLALLVSPVREVSLLAVLTEAAQVGVGCVLLNRWIDYVNDLRARFSKVPFFSVTADQSEVGRIQGRQLTALVRDGTEVIYIQGPLGTSSARKRHAGMLQTLDGRLHRRLVTFNADWSDDGGARVMEEWLRIFGGRALPAFALAAQNDNMAMGARNAFVEWAAATRPGEPDHVHVIGCDGLPSYGQRLVAERHLSATVVIPSVAGRALDELASVMTTSRFPPAEIVMGVASYPEVTALAAVRNGIRTG